MSTVNQRKVVVGKETTTWSFPEETLRVHSERGRQLLGCGSLEEDLERLCVGHEVVLTVLTGGMNDFEIFKFEFSGVSETWRVIFDCLSSACNSSSAIYLWQSLSSCTTFSPHPSLQFLDLTSCTAQ